MLTDVRLRFSRRPLVAATMQSITWAGIQKGSLLNFFFLPILTPGLQPTLSHEFKSTMLSDLEEKNWFCGLFWFISTQPAVLGNCFVL